MILFHPETWITLFQKNRVGILCESTEGAPLWWFSPVFSLTHLPMKYYYKYISDFHWPVFPWYIYIFQLLLLSLFDWKPMVSHFWGRLTNIPNVLFWIKLQISQNIFQFSPRHFHQISVFTKPQMFSTEPHCSFSKIIWFEVEHGRDIVHTSYLSFISPQTNSGTKFFHT